jgi:hypothetical protein
MNFIQIPPALRRRNLFSFLLYSKISKNPLFEVISLHGPTGPGVARNLLKGLPSGKMCESLTNLFKSSTQNSEFLPLKRLISHYF